MTYEELEIGTEIKLKEKSDDEHRVHKMAAYIVVGKYPGMCMVADSKGRRKGVAIGELVMNNVITQSPYFESMRRSIDSDSKSCGWRKRKGTLASEYAP